MGLWAWTTVWDYTQKEEGSRRCSIYRVTKEIGELTVWGFINSDWQVRKLIEKTGDNSSFKVGGRKKAKKKRQNTLI